ncbi:putative neuroblastoma breakpoint family member 5 [Eulemur rufifrons]|uniref:putative neuroblastoma breakpoint family member 5 n=1 Tax=Eulemur rufifrons TaxID=859984 RepID=UPI0037422F94
MAGSLCPRSRQRAEMDSRELRSQLVDAKEKILDLREKLYISESTAFSLANQLRKYRILKAMEMGGGHSFPLRPACVSFSECGEFRDVLESVLGVRLDFREEERAETPTLEDELREANRVIEQQARELTLLRQVLREGRDGSFLLQQHLQALLLQDNLDSCQGQGLREHLAEGRRLAEHLVHTLSPENHEEQEEEKEEEPPAPRLSGEEEEVNPTQQTSLREQHITVRSGQDLSESRRPSHSAALLPDAGDVCACPENYADEEDKEDLESLASSLTTVPSELQEDTGTEDRSQALTEQDFPPGGADLSDCQEPIRSAASLSAEHEVASVLEGADQGGLVPRELQGDAGTEGLSQALTEQDFPPGGADLSDCQEPIRSAASLSAEHEVASVLEGAARAPGISASPGTHLTGDISFVYSVSFCVATVTGWSH